MARKLRIEVNHPDKRRLAAERHGKWLVGAIDVALAAMLAAVLIWLQWLPSGLPG